MLCGEGSQGHSFGQRREGGGRGGEAEVDAFAHRELRVLRRGGVESGGEGGVEEVFPGRWVCLKPFHVCSVVGGGGASNMFTYPGKYELSKRKSNWECEERREEEKEEQ